MSTVSPEASPARRAGPHARRGDARRARLGQRPEAETGTLTIMVGGDGEAFAAVEPLLHELGSAVRHIGTNGQGLLLKLAVNVSLAAQMLAFSEGVLLAERGGIAREVAVDVMAGSPIGSTFLRGRAPLVLDLPDEAWFDVELAHKDIRLALATAKKRARSASLRRTRRRVAHEGDVARLRSPRRRVAAHGPGGDESDPA